MPIVHAGPYRPSTVQQLLGRLELLSQLLHFLCMHTNTHTSTQRIQYEPLTQREVGYLVVREALLVVWVQSQALSDLPAHTHTHTSIVSGWQWKSTAATAVHSVCRYAIDVIQTALLTRSVVTRDEV